MSTYTPEQLQAARVYAAAPSLACADHCRDADFGFADHVTPADIDEYEAEHRADAAAIIAGERDGNLTIAQRMHYHLTGECVALLP